MPSEQNPLESYDGMLRCPGAITTRNKRPERRLNQTGSNSNGYGTLTTEAGELRLILEPKRLVLILVLILILATSSYLLILVLVPVIVPITRY